MPVSIASLQDMNDLQNMLLSKMSDLESRLMAALSTKVDVQNLTVIDPRIQATVNAMATGVLTASDVSSSLAQVLNSKLTVNATCQCFDPRVAQALQSGLSSANSAIGSQAVANVAAIGTQAVANAAAMAALNTSLTASASTSLTRALTPVLSSVSSLYNSSIAQSTAISAVNASIGSTSNTLGLSLASLAVSLAGSGSSLSSAISSIGTVNTAQLSSAIVAVSSTSTINGIQLSASVASLGSSVNSSLTALSTQTSAGLRSLSFNLTTYYVDVRNLTTIDGEVAAVVTSMVSAGGSSSNALATILASKLNSSQVSALITASIRCQTLPPAVLNGDPSSCAGTVSAGSCAPTCFQGYSASGAYGCVAGTWVGSPVCRPNPCAPLLTPPTNGAASIINGTTGMNSTFSCNAGFSLVGTSVATCLASGSWSAAVPTCAPNGQTPTGAVPGCAVSTITTTGVYYMAIPGFLGDVFLAFCRVDPDGTKWLMFQRRTDTASFEQNWATYAAGFGTPTTNNFTGPSFWLGLNRLNRLTSSGLWKLRVDLQEIYSGSFQSYYQLYSTFSIGSASTRYTLTCGGTTSGTAGDSLCGTHSGYGFDTYDNDASPGCVAAYKVRTDWRHCTSPGP